MDPHDLTVYGPLGVLALAGGLAAVHMFRVLQEERKTHKAEMQAMVDRFIQTTTTMQQQYHSLAEKLQTSIDAIGRFMERRQGG